MSKRAERRARTEGKIIVYVLEVITRMLVVFDEVSETRKDDELTEAFIERVCDTLQEAGTKQLTGIYYELLPQERHLIKRIKAGVERKQRDILPKKIKEFLHGE